MTTSILWFSHIGGKRVANIGCEDWSMKQYHTKVYPPILINPKLFRRRGKKVDGGGRLVVFVDRNGKKEGW